MTRRNRSLALCRLQPLHPRDPAAGLDPICLHAPTLVSSWGCSCLRYLFGLTPQRCATVASQASCMTSHSTGSTAFCIVTPSLHRVFFLRAAGYCPEPRHGEFQKPSRRTGPRPWISLSSQAPSGPFFHRSASHCSLVTRHKHDINNQDSLSIFPERPS